MVKCLKMIITPALFFLFFTHCHLISLFDRIKVEVIRYNLHYTQFILACSSIAPAIFFNYYIISIKR